MFPWSIAPSDDFGGRSDGETDLAKNSVAARREDKDRPSEPANDLAAADAAHEENPIAESKSGSGESSEKPEAGSKPKTLSQMRHDPALIRDLFETGEYPYKVKMRRKVYERQKEALQAELLKAQTWIRDAGLRVVLVFEGRDAAGKGGTIRRFMEHLNPRNARVVALTKPTEEEQGQWYFQRYIQHFPTRGEMVLFDRSWYNRAGVERAMGFTSQSEYLEFLRETPEIERMWVRSGILLFKYWFSVTQDEQARRFRSRMDDPLKRWKLSPIDRESLDKWDEYTEAKEAMFFHTDTADAPWTVVKSNDKKRARINCMRHFLASLPYPEKDEKIVREPDPLIVAGSFNVISGGEIFNSRHLTDPLAH